MIPSVPDFYEYAYGVVWFFTGRYYAGHAYRVETEELAKYKKMSPRNRDFEHRPSPVTEATCAFILGGGLWPALLCFRLGAAFTKANSGMLHIIKLKAIELTKLVFLGRRPRAERRKIEREQMQARIKTLEKELELND